jgi:hypothetical protein
MNGMDLNEYFEPEQVRILEDIYAIKSMEQLLKNTSIALGGISKNIGIEEEKFFSILNELVIQADNSDRSDKEYSYGVEVKTYTLEQIKKAFWETFHRGGEFWFPYLCEEEVSEESTDDIWDSFTENLID